MNYLIKFDENGRRCETYIKEEKTIEQVQAMLDDDFEIMEEDVYQLLLGNVDGNEHIRNPKTGEFEIYVPPAPSLDEIKQAKLVEFKSTRDTLEVAFIEYNGNFFDYDEKARDRINAAIISLELLGDDASLSWTTADNSEAIVTVSDLKAIVANVAVRSNALHIRYRELKDLVEACTTKDELELLEW